jgi:hypothetical protein
MGRLRSTILGRGKTKWARDEARDGPFLDGIHLVAVYLEVDLDDIEIEREPEPLEGRFAGRVLGGRARGRGPDAGEEEAGGGREGGGRWVGAGRQHWSADERGWMMT